MKLYIAHVGFYDNELGIYELHTNFLVAATDAKAAKEVVKNKDIFIQRKMHIDGIQEITNVDGYHIKLEKSDHQETNATLGYDAVKALI